MSRNGLRPDPDIPDIPGAGAKKNKPLRTHYYYD